MHWLATIALLPYLCLILSIYRGLLKIKPFTCSTEPRTQVSVIIACRNEEKNLPVILQLLANQDYPLHLLEIIIIDDNSVDNTSSVAGDYLSPFRIITGKNTGRGKKMAVKTGTEMATGELIITTDADCRPGKRWVRTIAAFYEESNSDLIIGPVVLESGNSFAGKFQDIEFLSLQGVTAGTAGINNPILCNGANLAFTRNAYLKHFSNLHFDVASGDDIFLLHSIKNDKSLKAAWLESEDAVVKTDGIKELNSFLRQRIRWIGKSRYYKDTFTIATGIVTFVTILLLIFCLAAAIINPVFTQVFITVFIVKSLADYLILYNTTKRYNRSLMWWFLPSQIIYPFYIIVIAVGAIFLPAKWRG